MLYFFDGGLDVGANALPGVGDGDHLARIQNRERLHILVSWSFRRCQVAALDYAEISEDPGRSIETLAAQELSCSDIVL